MNNNHFFHGAYAILTTPFKRNGEVDVNALLIHVDELCQTDISGVIPCGSTGEFISTDFSENRVLIKEISRVVNGRKQLIGGATGADARNTLRYMDCMREQGYDAALVAPPFYFRHEDGEVLAFYQEIGASGLPVVAYNIPFFTSAISMKVYQQLLELPHVMALKNSSTNIKEIMHQLHLKKVTRPNFAVLTGTDDAIFPCILSGCSGSFTALAGIVPQTVCRLYEALEKQDIVTALTLQEQLLLLIRLADSLPFPVGYKLLSHAAGSKMGYLRQSLPAEMWERLPILLEEMRAALKNLGTEGPLRRMPPLQI